MCRHHSHIDFGGKRRIARIVWELLGDTPNYAEPFAGSLAVLLARPDTHLWESRTETVNDRDGLLTNFWRAGQRDPDAVAAAADFPCHEVELSARHAYLVGRRDDITRRLEGDPDYYDAKAAGWWVWGQSLWIGSGWCSGDGPWTVVDGELLHVGDAVAPGEGQTRQMPDLGSRRGVKRKLPHLKERHGVNTVTRGSCADARAGLEALMQRLCERLRHVRVCCGDWSRILGDTPTIHSGVPVGIFLDPPYSHAERDSGVYATESDVSQDVREWALAHGDDPRFRIILCGYKGEYEMPSTWREIRWKAHGGMSNMANNRGRANALRETLWASPHCIPRPTLFDWAARGDEGESVLP